MSASPAGSLQIHHDQTPHISSEREYDKRSRKFTATPPWKFSCRLPTEAATARSDHTGMIQALEACMQFAHGRSEMATCDSVTLRSSAFLSGSETIKHTLLNIAVKDQRHISRDSKELIWQLPGVERYI